MLLVKPVIYVTNVRIDIKVFFLRDEAAGCMKRFSFYFSGLV